MPRVFKFDLAAKRLSEEVLTREDGFVVWSSRPYPAVVVEPMTVGATLVSAELKRILLATQTEEQMGVGVSLVDARLAPILLSTAATDAAELGVSLTASELKALLIATSPVPDPLACAVSFVGGEMRVVLVSQDQLSENLGVATTLTAAYLGA